MSALQQAAILLIEKDASFSMKKINRHLSGGFAAAPSETGSRPTILTVDFAAEVRR